MQCGNKKFAQIVGTKLHTININGYPRELLNTNELLGNLEGVNGVKTGFTNNAGRCLVTSINRNGWEIIVVVLRADTKKIRTKDSVKIIEYVYKNYKQVDIKEIVQEKFEHWCKINSDRIIINKGRNNDLDLTISELKTPIIPIENTKTDNIELDITSLFYFDAPIEKNTTIGTAKVILNGQTIEVLNIYNNNKIQKKNIGNYFKEFLSVWGRSKN